MYDIFSNHKIMALRVTADQLAGTATQLEIDLQEKSSVTGLWDRSTRGLILIEVTDVNTTGTLTITFQDYGEDTGTWDTTFCTIAAIDEAGLYAVDLKKFRRKLRISSTVASATVNWGAAFIGFNATKRPVKQTDITVLTPTYSATRENQQAS